MCDDHTEAENDVYLGNLSRRQFTALTATAAMALTIPQVANAAPVLESDVMVKTPDGTADCYYVRPSRGKHPAVLLWPDIVGLRPAFKMMGKRLAESGFSVLVVNPYYRSKVAPVVPAGSSFRDPNVRSMIMPLARQLSAETVETDALAFVSWLDRQDAVDTKRKVGTMGYCMTGPFTMRTAAAVPDRIGAGASFHGASMVTDKQDSPHLIVPGIKARFLIAIAENDDQRYPEAKKTLREAYKSAGLSAEIEVYEEAMHGWCTLDSPVYHAAQAERAWTRLLVLFDESLV